MEKSMAFRLVVLARDNHREARREKRLGGKYDAMGLWYEGRAEAYMIAARMVQGGTPAKTKNAHTAEQVAV